jgi:tetratricopeptide (TPR) repeat protein
MEWAAMRASNSTLVAIRQYARALACMRTGQYKRGQRLIESGWSLLEQAEQGTTPTLAVLGQLHLGAAVLASRAGDPDAATGHLNEAGRVAERTGEVPKQFWLSFGPTNVAVHRVSALAELDRYAEAVDAARGTVVPASWPASRTAHHHSEVARALMWVGQTDAAFGSLLKARKIAPQQTRHHPVVRETVAGLVTARRSAPDSLSGFAHWMGI